MKIGTIASISIDFRIIILLIPYIDRQAFRWFRSQRSVYAQRNINISDNIADATYSIMSYLLYKFFHSYLLFYINKDIQNIFKTLLATYSTQQSNLFIAVRISNLGLFISCINKCKGMPNKTASLEFEQISAVQRRSQNSPKPPTKR